jgi:hypothetical protein
VVHIPVLVLVDTMQMYMHGNMTNGRSYFISDSIFLSIDHVVICFLTDRELDEKIRDAFHLYIEARGINEKLFPFLQAWLYVKDHRNLIRWFKSVGSFISESKPE